MNSQNLAHHHYHRVARSCGKRKVIFWCFVGICLLLFAVHTAILSYVQTDYGLICAKCMETHSMLEGKLFGITFSKKDRGIRSNEIGSVYEGLYHTPCNHLFHKGGFGRSTYYWSLHGKFFHRGKIACGQTAEGILFRWRDGAVRSTFSAYRRMTNAEMAHETLQFIESKFPASIILASRESIPPQTHSTFWQLSILLDHAQNVDEWKQALEKAKADFKE